ncbi:50S ribosomal protein L4 [Candidatus Pacearchaeota archaeon]|nr:50S ribosomal protein L4 [Candidatus Pacearchaeota archaeon]
MKATLYTKEGSKKGSVDLPEIFSNSIREDLVQRYFEVAKKIQPYSHDPRAGRKSSAAGTISHKRHDWKGHYGKGMSRAPRKTMWRRGTQFFWIGAETTSARGGRRVHGPMLFRAPKKINKKEQELALNIALAATVDQKIVISRYESLDKADFVPAVIESLPQKTKDLFASLKNIFSSSFDLILKKKDKRAGKGKLRGRKYKSNSGLLIITGKDETSKFSGVDVKSIKELQISDLYPLGRIVLYTKKAIDEFGGKK